MLHSTQIEIDKIIENFKSAVKHHRNREGEDTKIEVKVEYDDKTKTGLVIFITPLKGLNLASKGITEVEEKDLPEFVENVLMKEVLPEIPK